MTDCNMEMETLGKYKATFTFCSRASDDAVYIRDIVDIEQCSPPPTWITVADHHCVRSGQTGRVVEIGPTFTVLFECGTKDRYHPISLRRATVQEVEKVESKFAASRQRELDSYSAAELLEAFGRKTLPK